MTNKLPKGQKKAFPPTNKNLIKGTKGPLTFIFPFFFFPEELEETWLGQLPLSSIEAKENTSEQIDTLKRSPLAYLSGRELYILFFYEAAETYSFIKSFHSKVEDAYREEKVRRLETILGFWQKEGHYDDDTFLSMRELAQAYLYFFKALIQKDNLKSRKLMSLALFYTEEAQGLSAEPHPYFGLLKCLISIARGKWDQGTKELREVAELYPHPRLYRVLSRLYEKIGLPKDSEQFLKKADSFPLEMPLTLKKVA